LGYLIAIIINLIIMQIINRLTNWGMPFLTPRFNAALWAINLSIGAHILVYAVWLVYDERWFRRLTQVGLNVLAFISVFVLYSIFPFEFGRTLWDMLARFVLIVSMFGIALGTIVELVKLFTGRED